MVSQCEGIRDFSRKDPGPDGGCGLAWWLWQGLWHRVCCVLVVSIDDRIDPGLQCVSGANSRFSGLVPSERSAPLLAWLEK
jgi:hypothetical protein